MTASYVAPVLRLSKADVERLNAGKTDPRSRAEREVWLMFAENRFDPASWQASVWRAVTTALDGYEAALKLREESREPTSTAD